MLLAQCPAAIVTVTVRPVATSHGDRDCAAAYTVTTGTGIQWLYRDSPDRRYPVASSRGEMHP